MLYKLLGSGAVLSGEYNKIEWEKLEISSKKKKDRNDMDLTEPEDIKRRWQEYTEALYKKALHDSDNHYGMITFQPHGSSMPIFPVLHYL